MTQSKKIALTGGIGSGKSAASKIIKDLGYPVYSCDEIYREICAEAEYLKAVEANFPGGVKDGKLNREYLSALVFSEEGKRKQLESLAHPLIEKRLFKLMDAHSLSFAEVPLLFETGLDGRFDGILAIMRKRDARIRAVMERDKISKDAALLRLSSQRNWDSPPPSAYLIDNDGTLEELKIKIKEYLMTISPPYGSP